MNKYKKESRVSQKKLKKDKMCKRKRTYNSKTEAKKTGNKVYVCPFCKLFHTSGSFNRLINLAQKT